jgi:hypothetical protein
MNLDLNWYSSAAIAMSNGFQLPSQAVSTMIFWNRDIKQHKQQESSKKERGKAIPVKPGPDLLRISVALSTDATRQNVSSQESNECTPYSIPFRV